MNGRIPFLWRILERIRDKALIANDPTSTAQISQGFSWALDQRAVYRELLYKGLTDSSGSPKSDRNRRNPLCYQLIPVLTWLSFILTRHRSAWSGYLPDSDVHVPDLPRDHSDSTRLLRVRNRNDLSLKLRDHRAEDIGARGKKERVSFKREGARVKV